MSSDDDLKEFETRLQTLGVDSNLLQTVRDATLSFDHKSDGTPLRPSLHTLPELRLDRDSIEEQAPDLFVIETLGEGGMGVVRLANQMSLDREVAVKTLREDKGEEVAQALLEEAYITGYLEHPNIIPIYTVGRSESGAPLIVMKRIEGTSWRERLLAHDQWPPEDLSAEIEILIQVANAARFAHSRGVIHRDIKTENVMIGDFDEVYLLDWGVAISLDDSKALLPQPKDETGLSGTPGFLAPEMALQYTDVIDERTDVYLLGATLHEILTGQPRHKGSTLLQILYAANQSEPYDYGDQVPEELARIANCACHRDHRQRFPSAEAFR